MCLFAYLLRKKYGWCDFEYIIHIMCCSFCNVLHINSNFGKIFFVIYAGAFDLRPTTQRCHRICRCLVICSTKRPNSRINLSQLSHVLQRHSCHSTVINTAPRVVKGHFEPNPFFMSQATLNITSPVRPRRLFLTVSRTGVSNLSFNIIYSI